MASYSQAERGATGVNNHQLVPLPPLAVPIPRPPSTGVQRHHQCQAGAGIFGSSSILLAYCSPKQTKRHPPNAEARRVSSTQSQLCRGTAWLRMDLWSHRGQPPLKQGHLEPAAQGASPYLQGRRLHQLPGDLCYC